ncbi:ABC transporter transmembrane domain-containing protein [Paenibacillus chondroitinus]|uniref:ABC transporter transmembrane domain-containing protein n=1 Tax=Paenibacillus chondroitinus TaxID=59842 RepID=A0ABU6DLK8_9BACL|nr:MULTISPECIES: ABC transporter transmembrane domain-containing protein [Paenibacillus]MCY9661464.1 ABC transporter transmembrane domain-containing protein [Paenibacillus anseongense]MEB4798674.1 ABC transporter transmembrane domain-containing protein [Paenibacillus chondroitinus]
MFIVLKKLGWFFRMNWKRYTLAIGLLIIVGIIDVIPPKLIGYAIDGIHMGTLTGSKLFQLLAFWGTLIVAGYGLSYVWLYQLFGGAFVLERVLRSRLMRQLLRMTPTFYERNRTGDLMARATNDLQAVSTTAGFGILTFVDSTLFMLTILSMMGFFISWKLTLASILPLPFMAAAITIYGGRIHERFILAQDAFGQMNDRVLETIAGVRVIRAFVQEKASEQNFKTMTDDVFRKNIAVALIDALFEPTVKILVGISYLIGLCYGGYMVFHSELTLGELVSFNTFLGMLIWPMFAIGELMNIMQRGNASLDRVNETLGYKPDVTDEPNATTMLLPNSISFQAVTFRYPSSSIDNLVNISFELKRGQTLGIVGRTGSGKTTLLKQLLREYPPGKGTIAISDTPIEQLTIDTVHGWIGYVPQEPILFSKTVKENIKFGASQGTEEQLIQALELAAFRKDVEFLPEGLETMVGEKGVALSGGQKQRVSIARALYVDPEILMLDDALSAVDAKTEAEIIRGIRSERAGKTTLITTHRLSAVQHADRILVLDEGYIVEEGTHEELLALGGWYKEQYDRQQLEEQQVG